MKSKAEILVLYRTACEEYRANKAERTAIIDAGGRSCYDNAGRLAALREEAAKLEARIFAFAEVLEIFGSVSADMGLPSSSVAAAVQQDYEPEPHSFEPGMVGDDDDDDDDEGSYFGKVDTCEECGSLGPVHFVTGLCEDCQFSI